MVEPSNILSAASDAQAAEAADTASMVEFLRDRDAACPLCGYNLRGLTSNRCPECGRELRLAIGLTEPYLLPWIALAISGFGGGGVGLLFVFVIIREGWPPGRIALPVIYFLCCIPVAILVGVTRRRFLRLSRRAQWKLASALGASTLIAFTVLVVGIR